MLRYFEQSGKSRFACRKTAERGKLGLGKPLESQRPVQQGIVIQNESEEIVMARLWQDPLDAIQSHWNDVVSYVDAHGKLPGVALPKTIIGWSPDRQPEQSEQREQSELRLFVTAPGTPYVNDVEQRRRQRYAIVTALTELDYKPADPERIGYVVAPNFSGLSDADAGSGDHACVTHINADGKASTDRVTGCVMLIGFERYKPAREIKIGDAKWKSILVLWLNAQDFEQHPLDQIPALMAVLDGSRATGGPSVRNNGGGNTTSVLLGPASSGALLRMKDPGYSVTRLFLKRANEFPSDVRDLIIQSGDKTEQKTADKKEDSGNKVRYMPDPEQLNQPIADAIAAVVELIDSYLDYGLPVGGAATLAQCISAKHADGDVLLSDALVPCLDSARLSEPEIEDSDEDWRETVVGLWERQNATAVREASQVIGDNKTAISLLLATHYYLDNGLPELGTDKTNEFAACFNSAIAGNNDENSSNSDELQSALADNIAECLKGNVKVESESDPDWAHEVANRWIGHNGSSIQAMGETREGEVNEERLQMRTPKSWNEDDITSQRKRLHILSPRATMPLDRLFKNYIYRIDDSRNTTEVETRFGEDLGVAMFRSVVARDDLVLRDILFELAERGACRRNNPMLAIVSEQDTVYGRLFDDIIKRLTRDPSPRDLCDFEIREFGYLRGVDGELPPRKSVDQERSSAATGDNGGNELSIGAFLPRDSQREQAFGDAQLDYVRRLAGLINYENATAKDTDGFVAIGVLGSDVYDKLLILQALRERLPSATFFTTDLDARLTDPVSKSWTRNLIVGSAYGLSVNDQQSSGFRDSYQTALYCAVVTTHPPFSSDILQNA